MSRSEVRKSNAGARGGNCSKTSHQSTFCYPRVCRPQRDSIITSCCMRTTGSDIPRTFACLGKTRLAKRHAWLIAYKQWASVFSPSWSGLLLTIFGQLADMYRPGGFEPTQELHARGREYVASLPVVHTSVDTSIGVQEEEASDTLRRFADNHNSSHVHCSRFRLCYVQVSIVNCRSSDVRLRVE